MTRTVRCRCVCTQARNARAWIASATIFSLAVVGCRDQQSVSTAARTAENSQNEARLVFTSLKVQEGDDVLARLETRTTAQVKPIGSYTVRIRYDSAVLEYVAEEATRGDAVQIVNPQEGEIRAAGISAAGFPDGQLVGMRFRARRSGPIVDVIAVIVEMHAIDRGDVLHLLSSTRVSAQLDAP